MTWLEVRGRLKWWVRHFRVFLDVGLDLSVARNSDRIEDTDRVVPYYEYFVRVFAN